MNAFDKPFCIYLFSLCFGLFIHAQQEQTYAYRDYEDSAPASVRNFYALNHTYQTYDFVCKKRAEYYALNHVKATIWDMMKALDTIVDESDPDLQAPQTLHAFQTAERLRKDGHPRWLILTGFIHDLGKVLILFDEPQWAVVGDTFPVGCAYSDKIVCPYFFDHNSDKNNELFQTKYGIYQPHCGLANVIMSWGHDEYLYQVVKNYLPEEALYIIRYHSFYAAHKEHAYDHLMDDYDNNMMPWVTLFSTYDLYSKNDDPIDVAALLPYYQELVAEYFPHELAW